jgi:hypothetical protein
MEAVMVVGTPVAVAVVEAIGTNLFPPATQQKPKAHAITRTHR